MKILLVDDEQLHLSGLSHIIKSHYTSLQLKCAGSAREALAVLTEFPADIILTDIEMPVISGLELIQELHRRSVSSKIIIVSAHDKFAYAQRAVELGMVSYLLKPFTPESIYAAIDKALLLIQEERDRLQADRLLQEKLDNTIPFYLNHLLNKLSCTEPDPGEMDFLHDIFVPSNPFLLLFTHMDRPLTNEIRSDFPLFIRQSLTHFGKGLSFLSTEEADTFCTILQLNGNAGNQTDRLVTEYLNSLEYDYAGLTFEVSGQYPAFPTPFHEAFRQMARIASLHYFEPLERAVSIRDRKLPLEAPAGSAAAILKEVTEQLPVLIRQQKKKEAAYSLQSLFRSGLIPPGHPAPSKKDFMDAVKKLTEQLFDLLLRVHSSQENISFLNQTLNAVAASSSIVQTGRLLSSAVCGLTDRLQTASDMDRLSVMDDCMKYIGAHYNEELSLETVAARYYFNPSYFSTLFHACTNQSFSEYLTSIRLSQSTRLLTTTRMKVYEIASSVGYNDCAYFNRVFKKEFGISPEKYRKLHSSGR